MSFPCVDPAAFDSPGGVVSPKDYMQWRHVATNSAGGSSIVNTSSPGGVVATAAQAQWTNTSPISQVVYAIMTNYGSHFVMTARKMAFLSQRWGSAVGAAPADPAVAEVSRHGGGADLGGAAGAPSNPDFAVWRDQQAARSAFFGAFTVPTTQTVKVRSTLFYITNAWDVNPVEGTDFETIVYFGGLRVDLFSYPVL